MSNPADPQSQVDADNSNACGSNSVLLFSARGSGDKYGAVFKYNKIGAWTLAAGNALIKLGWNVRDLQAIYPAPGVPSWKTIAADFAIGGPTRGAAAVALELKFFRDAATNSWQSVRAELEAAYSHCPARPILLAGYSQGGILMRYIVPSLPANVLNQIVSVDLIADPTEQKAVDSGLQHPANLHGLLTTDGIDTLAGSIEHGRHFRQTSYPAAVSSHVFQYCLQHDLVCNANAGNMLWHWKSETQTHGSYPFAAIGAAAAQRLGPAPPPGGSGDVYWANSNGGTVNKVPVEGGNVATVASGQSQPWAVAVDDTHVYWADDLAGTVNEAPVGGGTVTTLASGLSHPWAVAVNGTHVYWVDLVAGTVNVMPVGGGSVTTLASDQNRPRALAVDATHVYWVNSGDGTVNEVPIGGGTATTLATGQGQPWSVAVDGTHVYWGNYNLGNGTVNEVPLGGGSVTTLASGQSYPVSMAVDGTRVYWVDDTAGTVDEVPLGGGSVTTLASGQNAPNSLAVDSTYVYWVTYYGGTVEKVPVAGGSVTALATGQDFPSSVVTGP